MRLNHGQALWTLWRWLSWMDGKITDTPEPWLNHYLNYLRKAGIPFAPDELGAGKGGSYTYRYEHLGELGIALLLRRNGLAKKDLAGVLVDNRTKLREVFRSITEERLAEPQMVVIQPSSADFHHNPQENTVTLTGRSHGIMGTFLDLGLTYNDGVLISKMRVMNPGEMISHLGAATLSFSGLINIQNLIVGLGGIAEQAPEVRRGRQ